MPSLYEQQYDECQALYEQGKLEECVELGEYNLSDPGMSPYLRIKTFCILAGAADEWHKAERYRVTAESLYRSMCVKIEERKATLQPDDASLVHDLEGIKDLRTSLDEICHYQAEWAPEDYSVKGSCYPPREGRVKDLIAWRRFQSEEPQAEEGQDQMEDVVGEERQQLDDMLDNAAEAEDDDDEIPLEDPMEVQAAEEEQFGKDVNVIETLAKVKLDEEGASNQTAEHVSEDGKASKDGEGKRQGLRSRVADFADKMKGTSKLEKKASTQGLRRQASTMSLTNRPKWRGV